MSAERILLVEDDAATSRVIRLALRDFQVTQASSRSDALAEAKANTPDLVLMDYSMPGQAPEEFLDSLRQLGFRGPVVLCTGMTQPLALEVDATVIKPFDPDILARTVAAALNTRR